MIDRPQAREGSSATSGGRRALVAIADDAKRSAVIAALQERGWDVLPAADTLEAQSVARRERPSVVVLGGRLPAGGVLAALQRIKRNVHTADIPAIALLDPRGPAEKTLRAGGADECLALSAEPSDCCDAAERLSGVPPSVATAPVDVTADGERLKSLESTGLLEADLDDELDGLTGIAARVLSVPVALVSLVDHNRQFFKSQVGLEEPWATERETPLSHSFCQWVVSGEEMLAVTDAREHPVLRSNLAIRDLGVIAYAGAPIVTASGQTVGSMCAIDSRPRSWEESDLAMLGDLANLVEAHAVATTASPAGAADPEARERRMRTVVNGMRGGIRTLRHSGSRLTDAEQMQLLRLVDRLGEHLAGLIAGA